MCRVVIILYRLWVGVVVLTHCWKDGSVADLLQPLPTGSELACSGTHCPECDTRRPEIRCPEIHCPDDFAVEADFHSSRLWIADV